MLELVSIGVLGACLSALLCMITEGTPYQVPKIISFKEGLLRPRIIRSVNWPKWKTEHFRENEERRKKVYRSQRRYEKPEPEIGKIYRRHVQTSFSNFEPYTERKVPKIGHEVKECLKEDYDLPVSPDAALNSCKYCENEEISKRSFRIKDRSLIAKSITRLKGKLRDRKNDENFFGERSKLYNGEWTKVRTKKRRFILPKSLLIAKKLNNRHFESVDITEDPTDKQLRLNGRYCYLEALRIKTNKAEKNV